jgi:hypothetical protein
MDKLVNHYERWCRANKKLPVSKRRLHAEFNSSYRPTYHHETGRCYAGLVIKGTNLHVTIKTLERKAKPESELDHLLRFYSSIKGKTLTQEQIVAGYYRFVRQNELGRYASKETVLNTIRALGATPIKNNRVLALVC